MKNKTRSRVLCRTLCVLLTLITVFSAVALSVSAYSDSGVYYHIRAQSSGGIYYFGYDYENGRMITRSDGEENALYFTFVGGFYVEYAGQMWYGSCANAGWGAPNSSTISDGLMTLGTIHNDNKNDSAKYGAHFTGVHNNENRTIDTDFIFRCWYYARKNYPSGWGACSWDASSQDCWMQEAVSIAYRCEWDTRLIRKKVTPTTSISSISAWNNLPDNTNFDSSVTQAGFGLVEVANYILRDALIDADGLKGNIKRPDSYTMTFTKNGTTSIMHLLNMNNPDNERRNRQNMFIFRQSTDVTDYDISAKKVDADTGEVLAGATFKIEMKSGSSWTDMNMPLTTESDGIVTWSNFPPGTYRITETDAPSGYQIDPTPQEVTVGGSSSSSVTVTFRDQPDAPDLYTIRIYKYPEGANHDVTNTRETLAGAKFDLYKQVGGDWVYQKSLTTFGGTMTVRNNFENLEAGEYYVVETEAPEGYELDDTKHYVSLPDDVNNHGGGVATVILYLDNPKPEAPKYTIRIYKYPEGANHDVTNTRETLAGAKFDLYKQIGIDWVYQRSLTTIGGAMTVMNNFDNLEAGEYYVVETAPPEGYELDDTKHYVSLPDDVNNHGGGVATVILYLDNPKSKPKTGAIDVLKHDISGRPISGVTFELWYDSSKMGYTGQSATTGSSGIVTFTGLTPGMTYWVFETAAPNGYKFDPNKGYSATVVADKTTRVNNGNPIVNEPESYTFSLYKVKAGGYSVDVADRLPGAKFQLYKKIGGSYVPQGSVKTTDSSGNIQWKDLDEGTITSSKQKRQEGMYRIRTPFTFRSRRTQAEPEIYSVILKTRRKPTGRQSLRKICSADAWRAASLRSCWKNSKRAEAGCNWKPNRKHQ